MKKTIKLIWTIFALLVTCLLFLQCKNSDYNDSQSVRFIEDECHFNEFVVIDDTVYIYCEISIRNLTNEERQFRVIGDFSDDKDTLLKNSKLTAWNSDNNATVFSIKGNSKNNYSVVFIGEFAGTNKKENRLLPPLSIELLE